MSDLTATSSATGPAHYVRRPGEEPPVLDRPIRARRRPQFGQIVTGLIAITLLSLFIWSQATNRNMEWSVTGEYMFHPVVLSGVGVTIQLAIAAMLISIVLAFGIALMIQSHNKLASAIGRFYVWFFRDVPMLVQVLLWFNLAVLFPTIFGIDTNTIIAGLSIDLLTGDSSTFGCMPIGVQLTMISVSEICRAGHSTQRPPNESARNCARDLVRLAIVVFAPRR